MALLTPDNQYLTPALCLGRSQPSPGESRHFVQSVVRLPLKTQAYLEVRLEAQPLPVTEPLEGAADAQEAVPREPSLSFGFGNPGHRGKLELGDFEALASLDVVKVGETLGVWMEQSVDGHLTVKLFRNGEALTKKQAHEAAGRDYDGPEDATAFTFENFI